MDRILDYDEVDAWEPWLTEIVLQIASSSLLERAAKTPFEYVEDARDFFRQELGEGLLGVSLHRAFREYRVRIFHGTRLNSSEAASVERDGLVPLDLRARRSSLVGPLSEHPSWPQVEAHLDRVFEELGPGAAAGKREDGCIHFCLSRAGLLRGCNHYLYHGAEVDNHVVDSLFGEREPIELLRAARTPMIISVLVTFEEAVHAANPWGFDGLVMPTIIDKFFSAWAFRLAHPKYSIKAECDSVALRLPRAVPRSEIEAIEKLTDEEVGELLS